jgi:hypothetical protein
VATFASAMNTRRAATCKSVSRSPRTSQRRSPPSTIASAMARSRCVRSALVLVNHADMTTCDAFGNRPARGRFLMASANLATPDGTWTIVDNLGYDEAVTIGRTFEYVTAPPTVIKTMREDRTRWAAAGNDPDDYPGILTMPPEVHVIASFNVPPGTFNGRTGPACNG